ncbi:MAG: GtrA family protein [Ferruginibacter sp.]|nr:GtrA family protein [Cytophagales bacterium]
MAVKVESPVRNKPFKDFIVFFLVAFAGASVNFSARIIYGQFLPFNLSIVPAYLTGMIVGFVLTKRYAFNAKASGNTRREMVKFLLISLLALAVTYVTSVSVLPLLNRHLADVSLFFRQTFAHVTGMGLSFLTNFFGHKLFTFKSTGFYERVRQKQ